MFEFSVASKYLIPRRRQLSVSIISLISILVISLVVWLIVVFFSVTDGLEKSWVQKLTALTAPVRITPTPAYYNSYYYQIDSISSSSDYSSKTLEEKRESELTDPYDPEYDQEIPGFWPEPDLNAQNELKDLVQLAYASLDEIKDVKGLKAHSYELTASHIQINLQRTAAVTHPSNFYGTTNHSTLSYPAYLGNFVNDNPSLKQTLLPIRSEDLNNYLGLMEWANDPLHQDQEHSKKILNPAIIRERLHKLFQAVEITQLKTQSFGWNLPIELLPKHASWKACALLKDQQILRVIIPFEVKDNAALCSHFENQNLTISQGSLTIIEGQVFWNDAIHDAEMISAKIPLTLLSNEPFAAELVTESLDSATHVEDILFQVSIPIQGDKIKGSVPYRGLKIANFKLLNENDLPWIHPLDGGYILPQNEYQGEGILLPKSFKEAGVLIGDPGSLVYYSPTASIIQEQYIPVYAAGFYDPGIIPIGGKFILANPSVVSLIRTSHQQDDKAASSNGLNVQFENIDQADHVKNSLIQAFKNKGINRYWEVQTYREYDFTKEIMQELQSQKYLFMLIAIVIILVACSNIISMLVILVNDKKHEIGILRAMGATSKSIGLIFGLAGAAIGIFGSVLGITLAIITLYHIDTLVTLLSLMQGHEMFSSNLYGNALPSELSYEALLFVLVATLLISLLAGIVPAVKACLVRPSTTLRSTGS